MVFIGLWFVSSCTGELCYAVFLVDGVCELVFGIIGIKNFKKEEFRVKNLTFFKSLR